MQINIKNVSKKFGSFHALKDINLNVKQGELLALLGPSGCGKTTLLRIIAALEIPDYGSIELIPNGSTESEKKNVGFVFQHYALFKHMNVYENIAFGLKVKPKSIRLSKEDIDRKVNSMLELIQLEWAAKRYPHQLSGGQRQRVALARALAIEPQILLLDEPFGALDAKVRKELRRWLKHLHEEIQVTSIFVTHDQEEALELADRIVVMNQGEIIQSGTPQEVYDYPINSFVYNFLGNVNHLKASVSDNKITFPKNNDGLLFISDYYVRPHDIKVFKERISDELVTAQINAVSYLGSIIKLEMKPENYDGFLEAELSKNETVYNFKKNDTVFLKFENIKTF